MALEQKAAWNVQEVLGLPVNVTTLVNMNIWAWWGPISNLFTNNVINLITNIIDLEYLS